MKLKYHIGKYMDNRVKYAELDYRNRLFNACKGILRVKQGEASGMLKTAYDLVPEDYGMLAKAVEKAQMMQANGIPLGRAEKKALEMFDRMPDMAKMKVMNAGGLNINNYQNRSVNNYGSGNIVGAATGENARAAGGAQNNNENYGGVQYGSGNQQNYVGGAPGGGGYPYPYPYPQGYGAPPAGGGGGWGWGPNGWGYYGPDGKPATPPTEGEYEDTTEASKPEAEVSHYVMNPADNTVLLTLADGTKKRISMDDFKAQYSLGGPEKPKALPAPETGAAEGAKPEAGKPGGVVDKDGIRTENIGGGKFKRTFPDGHTETIDGTGKVVSKTDATGTKVTEPTTGPDGAPETKTTEVVSGTGDPEKDLKTTTAPVFPDSETTGGPTTPGGDGTGGPTDADYADMRRVDHRNKFVNDFVDRKNNEFDKRWNGAGIASGIAGAATLGTGGYHAGNALAKHLGWVDDKGNDKGWGAKALRWGGALLGAGFGGATGYYGAKGIDRARRQKGYREIGGRAYDRDVKPVVKDMDPSKIVTASYTNALVKKLRNQVGYRYYSK